MENEYTLDEMIDFMYAVMYDSDIEATPMINEIIGALEELKTIRKYVEPLRGFNTNNLYLEKMKEIVKR